MFAKAVAVSLLTLASAQVFAADCKVTVDSTDQMSFNTKAIEIDKSCKTFTVELTHSGSLPKNVMGHNWVLTSAANMQQFGAGMARINNAVVEFVSGIPVVKAFGVQGKLHSSYREAIDAFADAFKMLKGRG